MTYEPGYGEISSVELIGFRQPDGKINLGSASNPKSLDGFPLEIKMNNLIYVLETTRVDGIIEWGIYV